MTQPRRNTTPRRNPSFLERAWGVVSGIVYAVGGFLLALWHIVFPYIKAGVSKLRGLPGKVQAIILAVVCCFVILIVSIGSCSGFGDAQSNPGSSLSDSAVSDKADSGNHPLTAEDAHIPSDIDADVAKALSTALESNFSEDLVTICNEADRFAIDGPEVQEKLLRLAAKDPLARSNLTDFPDVYPQQEGMPYNEAIEEGTVPMLYQWDRRWGNTTYSSAPFSATGCAPTSFSMIYMALTGNNDLTPYDMGVRATDDGFETEFNGTANGYFEAESLDLGITCTQLDVDSAYVTDVLERGYYVICNAGNGDFSSYGGHFFVITKVNDDGTWSINDPYSSLNSSHGWDPDVITDQTKAFWAFSMA